MKRSQITKSIASCLALAALTGTASATDYGVSIALGNSVSGPLQRIGTWDGGDESYEVATLLLPNGLQSRSNWNIIGYNKIDLFWFGGDSPEVYSTAQTLLNSPRQSASGELQAYSTDSTGPHLGVISFTGACFHSIDFPALAAGSTDLGRIALALVAPTETIAYTSYGPLTHGTHSVTTKTETTPGAFTTATSAPVSVLPNLPASSKTGILDSYIHVGYGNTVYNASDILAVSDANVSAIYPDSGLIGTIAQTNPLSLNLDAGELYITAIAGSATDSDLATWLAAPSTILPSGQIVSPERTYTITYKLTDGSTIPVTLHNGRIRGLETTGTSTGSTEHGNKYDLSFDYITLGNQTPVTP